ncbi:MULTISPECIES: hypothetical protein [unclassified Frigoribacterium]|jgi:hypothetical protein|uniref:hypothetical protein n=1 Tax=unclassified Frigoribacterium TaxID=2627005 RepID=UPI0005BD8524|nr:MULTISPECIES: hypothetical protein [unclassified Frigoribacterium]KIU03109.1 hypothetical protein SZ60_07615 [Frigoribacterium sp. MEB024]MBD8539514.1 hypothetical protein [Frigoribacterium sp. CFBP 8751]
MSSNLAIATPSTRPQPSSAPAARPVEIVTSRSQRRARPKIAYALIATAALFVLLLAQLAISIALSDGAYKISDLQAAKTELVRDQQKYSEQRDVLSSPQNLAANADELGMVRNSNPVYLDLATGAVHGSPAPAAGADEATSGNLIPNTLLEGVPLTTKAPATSSADDAPAGSDPGATSIGAPTTAGAAAVPTETGAADGGSADESVASGANELAAPQTR